MHKRKCSTSTHPTHAPSQVVHDGCREAARGAEAGADGGATERELARLLLQCTLHAPRNLRHFIGMAEEHLAHAHGQCVLQVSSPGLERRPRLAGHAAEGRLQRAQRRQQRVAQRQRRRQVHRAGEGVVAGLPRVHVVVRVKRPARAERRGKRLVGDIRNHLRASAPSTGRASAAHSTSATSVPRSLCVTRATTRIST